MSRNTRRREKYEAEKLRQMAERNPAQFRAMWQRRLYAWALEAIRRGVEAADEESTTPAEERLPVFGVLEKAERLLALCGEDARRLVGCETREVLENECCKVIARIGEAHLYRLHKSSYPDMRRRKPQSRR